MFRKRLFIVISLNVLFVFPITLAALSSEYQSRKNAAMAEIYAKRIIELSQEWNEELGPMMSDIMGCVFTDIFGDSEPELIFISGYYSNTKILLYTIENQSAVLKGQIEFSGKESDGFFYVARDCGTEEVYLVHEWDSLINSADYLQEWKLGESFTETRKISAESYSEDEERIYNFFDAEQSINISNRKYLSLEKNILRNSDRTYRPLLLMQEGFQNPDVAQLREYLEYELDYRLTNSSVRGN